ncbi:hypothetical protein IHQ68_08625 [Chelatococcus sambhunathii]|uniref:Uncharacterized protein n=1 Tax=Chelatococcus sambhunathii TaxID=363953 RepID=A0ABU1DFJ6_9HYPH|nr:hypothetical protein [Chelatococcus sambhunathii]MDR4306680.1 hypothetical protein [Chelatococcus sambhunathii]
MTEAAETVYFEELETATDEAIAACDGDARATVAALLAANAELEAQVSRLTSRVSSGYARGAVPRR